jgi:hypothetical protein
VEEEDKARVKDAAAWEAELQDQEVIVSVHPAATVSLIRGELPATKGPVQSAEHR